MTPEAARWQKRRMDARREASIRDTEEYRTMNRNHMQEIIDRQDKAMSEIRDRRDMIGTMLVASVLVNVGFGITLYFLLMYPVRDMI